LAVDAHTLEGLVFGPPPPIPLTPGAPNGPMGTDDRLPK
jgi:hypothetical protein